jgi:hypothetical protein
MCCQTGGHGTTRTHQPVGVPEVPMYVYVTRFPTFYSAWLQHATTMEDMHKRLSAPATSSTHLAVRREELTGERW